MNNPITEIVTAIDHCAGARNADEQVTAFHRYFTTDASFLHPLCYVPSGKDSRKRFIGIFLFYRSVISKATFDITSVAFNEEKGMLYVDLIQMPSFRVVSWLLWGWTPKVPMHIIFHLRKEDGKWRIDSEEDVVQPLSILKAFPPFRPWAIAWYFLCEVMGLLNAYIFMILGIWRPEEHIHRQMKKDFKKMKNSP
ncbi:MAG: hypothetical protein M1834_007095 [Cirrosporium novae-zelandiae]|nr:MAG: hypothetical protein M1834_007095 [Cirrosporium novae-zelandiae]